MVEIPVAKIDALLDSDHPILDETLSETLEDETTREIHEIAGSRLEGTANLLLKLCQQNGDGSTGNRTRFNAG